MSENIIGKVAPWTILAGAVGYVLYTGTKLITSDVVEKQEEVKKIGVAKSALYGRCVSNINCEGGGDTTICQGSKCIPLVATDGVGRIRFAANELGLGQLCDKYYLKGTCDSCSSTAQCSADGITKDASDPSATSATLTSKFQCINGKCSPTILAGTSKEAFKTVAEQSLNFLEAKKKDCQSAVPIYNNTKSCTRILFL